MNLKLKTDYFYQDYSLPFVFYKNTLLGSEINCNTLYEFGINKIVVILTQGQGPLYVYKHKLGSIIDIHFYGTFSTPLLI
jgi:hypothetical protein